MPPYLVQFTTPSGGTANGWFSPDTNSIRTVRHAAGAGALAEDIYNDDVAVRISAKSVTITASYQWLGDDLPVSPITETDFQNRLAQFYVATMDPDTAEPEVVRLTDFESRAGHSGSMLIDGNNTETVADDRIVGVVAGYGEGTNDPIVYLYGLQGHFYIGPDNTAQPLTLEENPYY